jgi:uncharacterized membrane protein YeaQ/YmgE (transglycosylase-associated protein family)
MTVAQLIVYLLVAAIVGLIAERLVGAGPWGLVGNIIVGLLGIWIMLNVVHWQLPGDLKIEGVPILTSILGAVIIDLLLSLLLRGLGPRRVWRRR